VPLVRGVSDAQALLRAELKEGDIAVEIDVQPADLSVLADDAALESLLINLMRNAIDAMQGAPRRILSIHARRHGSRAVLQVTDTGPGIRADIVPRLFEPFVTSKSAGAGLGLGLVISAQLVRAAGGTLRAANRAEGGACFTVDLPIATLQGPSRNE
jgi:two-component system C4-dicarboxylate transport sensor histidine kinase DctB